MTFWTGYSTDLTINYNSENEPVTQYRCCRSWRRWHISHVGVWKQTSPVTATSCAMEHRAWLVATSTYVCSSVQVGWVGIRNIHVQYMYHLCRTTYKITCTHSLQNTVQHKHIHIYMYMCKHNTIQVHTIIVFPVHLVIATIAYSSRLML